jgi:hypothetical protein
MEAKTIIVLDPVSKPKVVKININPRPEKVAGLRVAMVDNTKPNFSLFLDTVEELLVSNYQVASVTRFRKPGRTMPLDSQVIAEIKKGCDVAITGLGD